MNKTGQILCGMVWSMGILFAGVHLHEVFWLGLILAGGMAMARLHLEWTEFLVGTWIGIGLAPLIMVILCFATLRI